MKSLFFKRACSHCMRFDIISTLFRHSFDEFRVTVAFVLRNIASEPEMGLPGRILAGLLPGKHRNLPSGRPNAGRRAISKIRPPRGLSSCGRIRRLGGFILLLGGPTRGCRLYSYREEMSQYPPTHPLPPPGGIHIEFQIQSECPRLGVGVCRGGSQ